jgi:hypothetical protein
MDVEILQQKIGQRFSSAELIKTDQGEELINTSLVDKYNQKTVLGWYKKYASVTYPRWFMQTLRYRYNNASMAYDAYSPNALLQLRSIELDMMRLALPST